MPLVNNISCSHKLRPVSQYSNVDRQLPNWKRARTKVAPEQLQRVKFAPRTACRHLSPNKEGNRNATSSVIASKCCSPPEAHDGVHRMPVCHIFLHAYLVLHFKEAWVYEPSWAVLLSFSDKNDSHEKAGDVKTPCAASKIREENLSLLLTKFSP